MSEAITGDGVADGRRGDEPRRSATREPARLRGRPVVAPLTAAFVLLAAALVGLGSAYFAVQGPDPAFGVRVGSWTLWPKLGSRDVDPYSRAILARTGEIPLSVGEGLALTAFVDADGAPLIAGCSYVVEGSTPPARYWTLTLASRSGQPARTPLGRSSMTSVEAFRVVDKPLAIALAREPQPGNWLQTPETGRFVATLRLYDTPIAGGSAALDPATLPVLRRTGCG